MAANISSNLNVADDPWKGCNPLDPAFRDNPYPALKHLREIDPVNQTPLGIWRLLRYDDVQKLLTGVRTGVRTTDGLMFGANESPTAQGLFMLQQDPPNHTRLRRLVSHAFTPRALNAWREEIQRVVDECLDQVASHGQMDVIKDLALPVPSTIICEMLGVRVEDRDRFTQWTAQATFGLAAALLPPDMVAMAQTAAGHLIDYFVKLIAERRANPRNDLLSMLISAEEAGDKLSFEELMAQSIGLLIAGFETTIGLIGNGVRALVRNPDQLAKLRERPDLAPKAIQECLRFEGPIVLTPRVLHEDAEFGGKLIPKNTMVWAMLASANRDPEKFADPDRLDIERDASNHVAFGGGAHFCLGYRLAELEAQAAIGTLARRFKDLRLESDTVEWGGSLFRVPGKLPISFGMV
ncbi:MAG TPA: cytochrome P450 [Candidatus Binataceae bacterium]|nr:cytochrome P450 [Candidatus Binataceae bacterium]